MNRIAFYLIASIGLCLTALIYAYGQQPTPADVTIKDPGVWTPAFFSRLNATDAGCLLAKDKSGRVGCAILPPAAPAVNGGSVVNIQQPLCVAQPIIDATGNYHVTCGASGNTLVFLVFGNGILLSNPEDYSTAPGAGGVTVTPTRAITGKVTVVSTGN